MKKWALTILSFMVLVLAASAAFAGSNGNDSDSADDGGYTEFA
jgi:hypothetical protein